MAMEGDNGIFVGWINRQYLDNSNYIEGRKVIVRMVEDFSWVGRRELSEGDCRINRRIN
jgi:hypothetical protein